MNDEISSRKYQIGYDELSKRFNILVDHLASFHLHLDGRFRHSRLADHILYPSWITVGETIETDRPFHHEHIVPCAYLFDECFKLFASRELDVARKESLFLLKRCLKVVVISKEKASLLDGSMGLRDKMPNDWNIITGDPFARIRLVYPDLHGIKFYNNGDFKI